MAGNRRVAVAGRDLVRGSVSTVIYLTDQTYSDFPFVILNAAKDQREATRPLAVLHSSALFTGFAPRKCFLALVRGEREGTARGSVLATWP